jgi:perosamine synthetase
MTTGNGGMIVSRRQDLLDRARYLTTQARDHAVEYEHHDVGWNYRLSSLQAAFGLAQLERVDEFLAIKARFARHYESRLDGVPGIAALRVIPGTTSAYWLFTIRVDPERYGMDARTLMARLDDRGIQARPLFRPLSRQQAFDRWCAGQAAPVADDFWQNGLNLPSSVGSSIEDIECVARSIGELAAERR